MSVDKDAISPGEEALLSEAIKETGCTKEEVLHPVRSKICRYISKLISKFRGRSSGRHGNTAR